MREKTFYLFALILFFLSSCNFSEDNISYQNKEYTIRDSDDFGVALFDNRTLFYYINDTVYRSKTKYYCLISGSLDEGKRWVVIKDNDVENIDSTNVDFKSCEKLYKGVLLKR